MVGGSAAQGIYREPNQKLLQGKLCSIVIDRGELHKAIPDSKGDYRFSETGVGVKPLVFIGTLSELIKFLYKNRNVKIQNYIQSLPFIYMSASYYRPRERFEGIYPIHDVIKQFTQALLSFVPQPTHLPDHASHFIDYATAMDDIKTYLDKSFNPKIYPDINKSFSEKGKKGVDSKLIYLKISYLQDKGAVKIGKKTVTFGAILYQFLGLNKTKV